MRNKDRNDYIPVEEAARLLGRQPRMTHRYAEQGRIRRIKIGRRALFSRADVEALAKELNVDAMPPKPLSQILPASDLLDLVREKDEEIRSLHQHIEQLRERLGFIQGEVQAGKYILEDRERLKDENQNLREELEFIRSELQRTREERDALKHEIEHPPSK